MSAAKFLYLVPLLPLVGATLNGFFGRRLPRAVVSALALAGPLAAFALAVLFFREALAAPADAGPILCTLSDWIRVGDLTVPLGFALDRLAAVMLLVITGVGSLIHIYSIGYMAGDRGYARFFAYLNLFLAMMLVLVLGDNLVLLFLGWEGVGLCSYLLIGFWYEDVANPVAGKKAFVVNRIGDVCFALGMFLAFTTYGTLDFVALNGAAAAAPATGEGAVGAARFWIPFLFFIGATGKSAQIPLYVWLPDAMAGPTPVSALIHAATMVTSGVYLLNRTAPVFSASPEVLLLIAIVGALTAFVAGFIALAQFDIKKVLAYSTVSQLGYMFLACGLGAFTLGMFHVVTHAFFKGLLFLGAGAVIHSMHHEQDMRRMGGLRKKIPVTFVLMLAGSLAIAGFPFFAGFFSKDAILLAALERFLHGSSTAAGSQLVWGLLWILGVVTAALTSFYTFRLLSLTFLGEPRFGGASAPQATAATHDTHDGHDGADAASHAAAHGASVHESPWVMLAPMAVLSVLAIVGGFLGIPALLEPAAEEHADGFLHTVALALGVLLFLVGPVAVWFLYHRSPDLRTRLVGENSLVRAGFRLSSAKLYVDEIYNALFVRPLHLTAQILYFLVDRLLIDGLLVGGSGFFVRGMGRVLRLMQTGRVPTYAAWVVGGAVVLLLAVLVSM